MYMQCLAVSVLSTLTLGGSLMALGPDDNAESKEKKIEALCPVSGEPINFAARVKTETGPVYLCCRNCIAKYQADPSKYAEGVEKQRKSLEGVPKVQSICPVCGGGARSIAYMEYKGHKISVCGKFCMPSLRSDPEKYWVAYLNSFTYQTKCPVTGRDIYPRFRADLENGERICFCNTSCIKKFFSEPAKYLPNLEKQGYRFSLDELKRREQ